MVSLSELAGRELPPSKEGLGSQGSGRPGVAITTPQDDGTADRGPLANRRRWANPSPTTSCALFAQRNILWSWGKLQAPKLPRDPKLNFLDPETQRSHSQDGPASGRERVICKTVRGVRRIFQMQLAFEFSLKGTGYPQQALRSCLNDKIHQSHPEEML